MNRKGSKTTGIETYVIDCMCLRLKEREALAYLSERGYDISNREYYRIKQEIQENTQTRLNQIGLEFSSQHLERIDMLKLIQNELIEQYKKEQNPTKKANILMQLAELQQYLSSYYDSSSYAMERAAILKKRRQIVGQ